MANLLLATVNLEPWVQNPMLWVKEEFYRHAKKELIDKSSRQVESDEREIFCYHIYSAIRQVVSFPKHTKKSASD